MNEVTRRWWYTRWFSKVVKQIVLISLSYTLQHNFRWKTKFYFYKIYPRFFKGHYLLVTINERERHDFLVHLLSFFWAKDRTYELRTRVAETAGVRTAPPHFLIAKPARFVSFKCNIPKCFIRNLFLIILLQFLRLIIRLGNIRLWIRWLWRFTSDLMSKNFFKYWLIKLNAFLIISRHNDLKDLYLNGPTAISVVIWARVKGMKNWDGKFVIVIRFND